MSAKQWCTTPQKMRFPNQPAAERWVARWDATHAEGGRHSVYLCPSQTHWHLTTHPDHRPHSAHAGATLRLTVHVTSRECELLTDAACAAAPGVPPELFFRCVLRDGVPGWLQHHDEDTAHEVTILVAGAEMAALRQAAFDLGIREVGDLVRVVGFRSGLRDYIAQAAA